jgi:histidinol-phosphate/aromatic aminotransferase/cobyric acid decarboxylase-like protein
LEQLIAAAVALPHPPLVVVDEAYFEFAGQTAIGLRARYPNLVVVRTMSKAFGLAGLRVGFGVADRSVIERLERVRPPGSVSTVSAHVAAQALRSPAYALDNVALLAAEREWLAAGLAARGWQPAPSTTNFLLVAIGDHEAAERAADGLLHAGIVPRTFGPANPLRGHLRLTVRSRPENERLLQVVERL